MEKVIKSLDELNVEAASFVGTLTPQAEGATLVTLTGELGAGKTAFVKEIAKILGVEEVVTSPTFVLEKIYILPAQNAFKRLVHIDAYRLESGRDLAPLGFDELMKDSGNLVLLEWPERVADALPAARANISLKVESDGSRTLSYV